LVASHAYSDNIKVTITEDIVKNDTECSLREAIDYINQGMQALILSQNVQVLVRENMKNMYVMAAILKLKSAIISVHSLMKLNM
jgi:CSLREA domain-containing protein